MYKAINIMNEKVTCERIVRERERKSACRCVCVCVRERESIRRPSFFAFTRAKKMFLLVNRN
jgi:hypothetical protein